MLRARDVAPQLLEDVHDMRRILEDRMVHAKVAAAGSAARPRRAALTARRR